jgi:hypothetical protein
VYATREKQGQGFPWAGCLAVSLGPVTLEKQRLGSGKKGVRTRAYALWHLAQYLVLERVSRVRPMRTLDPQRWEFLTEEATLPQCPGL